MESTQKDYKGISHPKFEARIKLLQETLKQRIASAPSQRSYAKTIQESDGTLIAVRNGDLESISEKKLRELEAKVGVERGWKTVATRNFDTVQSLCNDALENRRLVATAAPTGLGKTSALKFWKNNNGGGYVFCHSKMTESALINAIQASFGISMGGSFDKRLNGIVTHLQQTDTPMLILDDVGKVKNYLIPVIQLVYDLTEGVAGIVLAGTEKLKENFEEGVKQNYKGFRELNRRVGYWQPLYHPTASEVRYIANQHGITDKPALNWLIENTSDYGSLRNYIENANRKAAKTKSEYGVTRELLNDLHVGDFAYRAKRAA